MRTAFDLGTALSAAPAACVGRVVWEHLREVPRIDMLALFHAAHGGDRLCGWVAATGRHMLNADPALDFTGTATDLQAATAVRAVHGDAIVVVAVYSRTPAAFTGATAALLEAIGPSVARLVAEQAAVAGARWSRTYWRKARIGSTAMARRAGT